MTDARPGLGLRLKIMKFRAESIGAGPAIEPSPGHGTRIRCVFQPFAPGSDDPVEREPDASPAPPHG